MGGHLAFKQAGLYLVGTSWKLTFQKEIKRHAEVEVCPHRSTTRLEMKIGCPLRSIACRADQIHLRVNHFTGVTLAACSNYSQVLLIRQWLLSKRDRIALPL